MHSLMGTSLFMFKHTRAPFPNPRIRLSPKAQDAEMSVQPKVRLPGYYGFWTCTSVTSSASLVNFFKKLDIEFMIA